MISLRDALPEMREMVIDEALTQKVRRGYQPSWEELTDRAQANATVNGESPDPWVKLVENGRLVAIMKVDLKNEAGSVRTEIERVFSA